MARWSSFLGSAPASSVSIAVLVLASACGARREGSRSEPAVEPAPVAAEPAALPAPLLPGDADRFDPARVSIPAGSALDGAALAKTDDCAKCHADVAEQWRSSAHAFASFSNPIYRVSIDRFRAAAGKKASRFCAGCHDLALLADGVIDAEIEPEDPRAHAGIGCRACHGITEVTADGNGSFRLRADAIPLPIRGDSASVERHRRAVSRKKLGARLCISCHRAFLGEGTGHPHHLAGMDDATAWQSSAYSGSGAGRVDKVAAADCLGCHMKREKATRDMAATGGKVASHRFLGGHSWLASMRSDRDSLARVRGFLQNVASIDIAAVRGPTGESTLLAAGAPVRAGQTLTADVVVRNLTVGHRFPSGVLDAQDTWVELDVIDARGKVIARAGHRHRRIERDPSAHVLRALVGDDHGEPLLEREIHAFRATVVNHTVAPRDAVAVRYRFAVPRRARQPLRLQARLVHRTRNLDLQRAACKASRDRRGRRFAAGSKQHRGKAIDACAAQPLTIIASTKTWIGEGSLRRVAQVERPPRWRRLYEYGMALLHSVQERVGEAGPPLAAALEVAPTAHARAAVMTALGQLAGKQGRTADAMAWLDRAERLAPKAAAIPLARARALTRVWRWREAVPPLRKVTSLAPENVGGWVALAITLGSAGDERGALDAARLGLRLLPREPNLLRVQATALRGLKAPRAQVERALDAYARFRSPDVAPHLRIRCAAASDECARERVPVHTHEAR